MSAPVFEVENLRVVFETPDGAVEAVKGISLSVAKGETLAVVGESGSGKSQTMMAAMGLLATNGSTSGSVRVEGQEMLGRTTAQLDRLRGSRVTMIFQEPMTSLDPLFPIGSQLVEPLMTHGGLSRSAARAKALDLLRLVGIPQPERKIDAYPHEMSGGQRQRVMIAMAIGNDPAVLVADEPTTALDVTVQAQILALLKELQTRLGMAIVFITHDLGVVRRFADRVAVMRRGEIVEQGAAADILTHPKHPYTQMLLDAEPRGEKAAVAPDAPVVVEAKDVEVTFSQPGGLFKPPHLTRAVRGVSATLRKGQTLGVVGESGSGKSTFGRALLKLVPSSGAIAFEHRDLRPLDKAAMRPLRKSMQLVFQDPFGSLQPRMSVGDIITEGLLVHAPDIDRKERERRAAQALREVGLDPAARNRYPHEFSGGQRQRIAIARAMILEPAFVVLDEPTSALDRSVQQEIVALLRAMQEKKGLTYLFISHDLAVVRAMADEILVMKDGAVMERGSARQIFDAPQQDYTRALMAAAFLSQRRDEETPAH